MAVFELLSLQVLVLRQLAHICHNVNMEWSVQENHVAVIALHNCGKSHSQIFKLLKPLKISRMFIYWAIKHYKELWRVENRACSGRVKSVRDVAAIKTVWEQIRQNPLPKQKIMSQELNILTRSMLRFVRDILHMRDYQWSNGHLITLALKECPVLALVEFRPYPPGL
jgi:hypothetical protein